MKIVKHITLLIATVALVTACGESLEDTYKEYGGSSENRYIGKCTNMTVAPGWKRLIVNWTNSIDPIIDKIKVSWKTNGNEQYQLLDKGTTTYNIPNLEDASYEVTVSAVDKDGNESLPSSLFARPYTDNHEEVLAFNRLISKHYFHKNRLILNFLGWDENIEQASLNYTKTDGSTYALRLTPEIVNQLYYLVPDAIDTNKPVTLSRSGHLAGCEDLIEFAPYELETDRVFSADFKQEMKRQFGFDGEIPDSWVDQVEELNLDWSISTLQDLLYFPNLKKVVLGKNRFQTEEGINDTENGQSKIYEPKSANFALQTLNSLNGLTVDCYNKHFSELEETPFIHRLGNTTEPSHHYIDLSKASITVLPEDADGYDSHLNYLIDGNINSSWDPFIQDASTTYEIIIDLNEKKTLKGMKFVQTYFDAFKADQIALLPSTIRVQLSDNQIAWENAAYTEEVNLGKSTGETNIIPFVNGGKQARYVRIQVTTNYYHSKYDISFAEIGFY